MNVFLFLAGPEGFDIKTSSPLSQGTYIISKKKCARVQKIMISIEVYRNNLLGLDEMIQKLWTIADSPKSDSKEKIEAITLMDQLYRDRIDLIRHEPGMIEKIKSAEHMHRIRRRSF